MGSIGSRPGGKVTRRALLASSLLLGIAHTFGSEGELSVGFGEGWTVHNAADAILTAALAQTEASRRCVCDDVATNRFGAVLGETHPVGIGNNLVGNENRHPELFRQSSELTKELCHLHLTFAEFTAAHVIGPEQRGSAVYNQERVAVLRHDGSGHFEQFHLMFTVVCAGVRDILQCHGRIQTETFGNCLKTTGTETPFRIQIDGLAFGATVCHSHLARNAQGVTQLCLAGTEFTKHFRDGTRLNATFEELVQFDRTRGERDERPDNVCVCVLVCVWEYDEQAKQMRKK